MNSIHEIFKTQKNKSRNKIDNKIKFDNFFKAHEKLNSVLIQIYQVYLSSLFIILSSQLS